MASSRRGVLALTLALAALTASAAESSARHYMVAAAHPLAVEAGLRVLERGGNAIDAMVATQLALNVVEPGSSGLGGGGFLLYYDARHDRTYAYDAREAAPSAATPSLFLDHGRPMKFQPARLSGRSVGVPGTPRLLALAHERHGKLPWASLVEPAIALAENGFPMGERFHDLLAHDDGLSEEPAPRRLYFDGDHPKPVGTLLRNPELADTLRILARDGAEPFYSGAIARDIAMAVRGRRDPGSLSFEDLAAYRVREVEPLCGDYRDWKLCGMPPPSSGGVAVLQVLGMLERFDLAALRPRSADAIHLVTEAERLAFADRARYLADDRFAAVPLKGLLDRGYIASRSQLIRPEVSMGHAESGQPKEAKIAYAPDAVNEVMGTTHISIVDGDGNAVAMTSSIEWFLGSRIMVRGFVLNNELTDFSFAPTADGKPVANAVGPGKRPRSSMAPFLVFSKRDGHIEMSAGSAGGSFIIGYVVKTLLAMLDWNLDPQHAVALPNFDSRNGPTELEQETELASVAPTLKAMGHEVRFMPMPSGTQAIRRSDAGWQGGADPRRDGVARGR